MSQAEKFYPKLHAADPDYSAGEYRIDSLLSLPAVKHWARSFETSAKTNQLPIRMLDVGCGKGLFLRDFAAGIKSKWRVNNIQAAGIDLVRSPGDHFAEICDNFHFSQQNLDGHPLPFENHSFDFLSCNHVLEHIFETESLLHEFKRVLSPKGICVISVPNTAAWVNRVLFLFASQPLGSEIGTEKVTYGFWPTALQPRLEKFKPSGHIRDFTPRGLHDLTSHCGFETIGWWKQSRGIVASLGKWAGRGLGIVLKPSQALKLVS